MNPIQNFAFEEHLVRVVDREGEPWFVGKDVCIALGIRNHKDALGRLDEDERAEVGIADPSGTKHATAVSEPGVYRLTFSSRKPEGRSSSPAACALKLLSASGSSNHCRLSSTRRL
jgi:prophage antirepressor-like protein